MQHKSNVIPLRPMSSTAQSTGANSTSADPAKAAIEAALHDLDLAADEVSLAIGQRQTFLADYLRSDAEQPLDASTSELLGRQLGIPAWVLKQPPTALSGRR